MPVGRRVAVVGSGGLSHRLPLPDWRSPDGDDEEFMVRCMARRPRTNWQDYEDAGAEIIRAAHAAITPGFDAECLDHLTAGTLRPA